MFSVTQKRNRNVAVVKGEKSVLVSGHNCGIL